MTLSTSGANVGFILAKLLQKQWVIDQVAPHFRAQLVEQLERKGTSPAVLSEAPLLELTARFYHYDELNPDSILMRGTNPLTSGPRVVPSTTDSDEITRFWKMAASQAKEQLEIDLPTATEFSGVGQAITRLRKFSPVIADIICKHISHICCFAASGFRSFSHPHFFGCIFLDPSNTVENISISLVHELAHQELFALNLMDRLVNLSADYSMIHAPLQGKVRPTIGRLHSAHALYRMIQFHKNTGSSLLSHHQSKLFETINSFLEHELTPFSKRLVYEVYIQECSQDRIDSFRAPAKGRAAHG